MNQSVKVEILIATYNGEKYLPAQLDSILSQTYQDFRILIRDDGSTDSTPNIIETYKKQYPSKIQLIPQNNGLPGLIQNFSTLISSSTAPYLMLSDQDDVWLPVKVERMLNCLKQVEETAPPTTPILVHSDLIVVDSELNEIAKSFWRYIGINPHRNSFSNILVQNVVTGCASMFNRALANLSTPIPNEAMMHDWWLALVATSLGILEKIETPTGLYRQHGANALGAQPFSLRPSYLSKRLKALYQPQGNIIQKRYIQQAEGFFQQYHELIPHQQLEVLVAFKDIKSKGFLKRRLTLLQYDLLKNKFAKNFWLLIQI